jgi:hypothetical protein
MERLGDEAEEGADGDDLGEDDREYLIKGDRIKKDSDDTTDEEMMMQDEALKNQEISKEELAQAVETTDTTGTRAYHIDAELNMILTTEKSRGLSSSRTNTMSSTTR